MEVDRRSFVKGLAFMGGAAALAGVVGCTPEQGAGTQSSTSTNEGSYQYAKTPDDVEGMERIDTDVLVVGGGGAGASAALSASENGAKVVICEKISFGGATAMSSGMIPAVGTKQQMDAGVEDSIGALAMDILRPSDYSVREDLVYTVAESAKEIVEWTETKGVEWSLNTSLTFGQTVQRMHTATNNGAGIMTPLVAAMDADENITEMVPCEILGLIVDGNTVVGGYGKDDNGGDVAIFARNTILATSGFGNNPDMVKEYCPEASTAVIMAAPGATGESILWAEELGAVLKNMGAWQGYAFHTVDDDSARFTEQAVLDVGGILLNHEGNRFCNERGGYSQITPHVLAQTDEEAYICYTDDIAQLNQEITSTWASEGIVFTGSTPTELANAIGADAATLEATISDYRNGIQAGTDKFNRSDIAKSFEPPYHAVKITGEIRHTQGGMSTDVVGHVYHKDGGLIPGLFATGGCMEGYSCRGGTGYMSGNGLLEAFVYGRKAGTLAATEDPASAKEVTWTRSDEDAYV